MRRVYCHRVYIWYFHLLYDSSTHWLSYVNGNYRQKEKIFALEKEIKELKKYTVNFKRGEKLWHLIFNVYFLDNDFCFKHHQSNPWVGENFWRIARKNQSNFRIEKIERRLKKSIGRKKPPVLNYIVGGMLIREDKNHVENYLRHTHNCRLYDRCCFWHFGIVYTVEDGFGRPKRRYI